LLGGSATDLGRIGGSDLGEQVRDAVLAADPVELNLHWWFGASWPDFRWFWVKRALERADAAR
jgi:hypothetical protein